MGLINLFQNRSNILGLNERSLDYIRKYNLKKAQEIADNKLLTKKVLQKAEIPTPLLLKTIKNIEQLNKFKWSQLPPSFVVKPSKGLEGGGIEIVYNRDKKGNWIKADKSRLSETDLYNHAKQILEGRFSLFNEPDVVMIEERIRPHKKFKYYTYKGTPDIRIIIFNNIPVMAMLRLPTRQSDGKANLDKGALGVGIDLANGTTTNAIAGKKGKIETIPGTKLWVSGLKIPFWDKILEYAIKAQKATDLNFAGIDFLIDREKGPVIVEMNARPGLSVQLANEDGLRWRLKKSTKIKVSSPEKGIRLAKDLFGGEIDEEITSVTGKQIIGIYETISIVGPNGITIPSRAKIDTGADSTSIDQNIAKKIGYKELIEEWELLDIPENLQREVALGLARKYELELNTTFPDLLAIHYVKSSHGSSLRLSVKIQMEINSFLFSTNATIYSRENLTYPIIVGRKSLQNYLVDPSRIKSKV